MEKNCSCPGCCYLVPMGEKYCAEHRGEGRHQRPPHMVHATVGETHFVHYPTHVGMPEGRHNKI